jgi:hypothetical protein
MHDVLRASQFDELVVEVTANRAAAKPSPMKWLTS